MIGSKAGKCNVKKTFIVQFLGKLDTGNIEYHMIGVDHC